MTKELFERLKENAHELVDYGILRDAEDFLAAHPLPSSHNATTRELKWITKCASYALDEQLARCAQVDYNDTILARAYAHSKIGAARIESGDCE